MSDRPAYTLLNRKLSSFGSLSHVFTLLSRLLLVLLAWNFLFGVVVLYEGTEPGAALHYGILSGLLFTPLCFALACLSSVPSPYRGGWKGGCLGISLGLILGTLNLVGYLSFPPSSPPSLAPCRGYQELDAVISWVNVSDPLWQAQAKRAGCSVAHYLGGAGDVDPFDALKFNVRGLRKNLPFIRDIFILSERPQIPSWFLPSEPDGVTYVDPSSSRRIRIVFHDEFFREGTFPAFNGNPTEYQIDRLVGRVLPSSSKCFLYLNDDFLLPKPLPLSDFISRAGRMVVPLYVHTEPVPGKWIDLPLGVGYTPPSGEQLVDSHVPYMFELDSFKAMLSDCGDECDLQIKDQCNRWGSGMPSKYTEFLYRERRELLQGVSPWELIFTRCPLGLPQLSIDSNLRLLQFLNPKFVYIDSHNGIENKEKDVELIQEWLRNTFPEVPPWEREDGGERNIEN